MTAGRDGRTGPAGARAGSPVDWCPRRRARRLSGLVSTSSRSRFAVVVAALVAVVAVVSTACATFRPPAWQVGDVSVSVDDFYQEFLDSQSSGASSTTTASTIPTSELAAFMTNEIQKEILRQGVADKGVEVTDQDLATARQSLEQSQTAASAEVTDEDVEIQASVAALSRRLARDAQDLGFLDVEAEARELYEANKDQLVTPGETCAHFILVAAGDIESTTPPTEAQYQQAEADAQAALARLATEDFEAVSRDVSAIEEQLPGGDFGCQTVDQFPTEVQPVIEDIEPGQLAGPTRITGGYLITRVDSRTPDSEPPSFEEVREDAIEAVLQQQGQSLLAEWLLSEARTAFVVVDPRFGAWNAETATVDPPAGAATPTVPTTGLLGLDPSGLGELDPGAVTGP